MENTNENQPIPTSPVSPTTIKSKLGFLLITIYLIAGGISIFYGFNCSGGFRGLRPMFYPIFPWPYLFSTVLNYLSIPVYIGLVILNSVIFYIIGLIISRLFNIDIPTSKARKIYLVIGCAVILSLVGFFVYRFANQRQPIGGPYYKNFLGIYEKRDIFHGGFMFSSTDTYYKKVESADVNSFKFLADEYATDGIHVFCGQVIPEIDAASFQVLSDGYAKDKNNLYWNCNKLLKKEAANSNAVSFDVASVQPLQCYSVKDKDGVYINTSYSEPDGPVYFQDTLQNGTTFFHTAFTLNKVDKADSQTFKITDSSSCKAQDTNYSYVYRYEPPNGFNIYNITLQAEQVAQTTIQWQLYSNVDSRIKIYYPQDWITKVFFTPQTGSSTLPGYLQVQFGEPGVQANSMPVMFENNNLTKLYRPMSSLKEYILDQYRTANIQEVTINGKQAEQFSREDGVTYTYFIRESDKEIFEFILWNNLPKYQNIYKQMLEKFEY